MSRILLLVVCLIAMTSSLMPRNKAIDFEAQAVMPDLSFKSIKLDDYKGKYVVLLFYPFDFTYVCPTQIISYSNMAKQFRKINTQVLAVSVDSHFSHLAWRKTGRKQGGLGQIDIPLVSDITKQISASYGVLVDNTQDALNGASLRGLVIIDSNKKVRSITINDQQVGRSVDETYRLVQAFQHADKHGVVCPANWKPGSKTIIPDQVKMSEYFESAEL